MADLTAEWNEQQRRFQARALTGDDADDDAAPPMTSMWFRTTVGASTDAPTPPLGRIARAAVMVVGGAAVVGLLLLLDVPRVAVASVAALWGGATLLTALAGPGPRDQAAPGVALVALWPLGSKPGDDPRVVAEILTSDRRILGVAGEATVIGQPRPGGHFGVFADRHLVWPQAPPRRARPEDPRLGD